MGINRITENWSKIASENSETQQQIKTKADRFSGFTEEDNEKQRGFQVRAALVQQIDSDIMAKIMYIILGGTEEGDAELEKDYEQYVKPYKQGEEEAPAMNSEPETGVIQAERKKSKKKQDKLKSKILKKFSSDEIMSLCRSRYNLLSMEDFLIHLNKLNSASSGKLFKDQT